MGRGSADDVAAVAARARVAAEALGREGVDVRHLQTAFLPGDEVCLHLFEAASAADVAETLGRAALPADRIVEARAAAQDDRRASIPAASSAAKAHHQGGDPR